MGCKNRIYHLSAINSQIFVNQIITFHICIVKPDRPTTLDGLNPGEDENMINKIIYNQQPSSIIAATENEAMTSNGFKAIFTTTATDGKDVKITIEHNHEDGSDFISPLWGVVAAANAYAAVPTALLGSASKAAILKDFGVAVFGDEEQFIRAFNTAAMRLAVYKSFADWCEANDVDRFAVAQNIVFDGYDMYSRVQDSGVEAVYGDLVRYYGEPIFEIC